VEDKSGTKYDYNQYITIGDKKIRYEQPDIPSGLRDPSYLIRLGTNPSGSDYLVEAWVSFTKPFNSTDAVGKTINLFGKDFTISAESAADNSKIVLFGVSGKETIQAGESKTITVGGNSYTVKVIGVIDHTSAVIEVNGVQKEVVEGNTYDFAGTSVYVSDVFYVKVPQETGYVVVSIGADRYVLENNQPIKVGTSGNEVEIKGTHVVLARDTNDKLTDIKIHYDAYSASPAVDYIKAGSSYELKPFGVKVAYKGTADVSTESIVVQPGATNQYTVTFTDKYGKSGTITWAYDPDTSNTGNERLADSTGNDIVVVEGRLATLNQYVFAANQDFPHMLKVVSLEVTEGGANDVVKVTFRDVFSGTEYKVEKTGALGTLTSPTTLDKALVIDGIKYDVIVQDSATGDKVGIIRDDSLTIAVYPILYTKYGAKVAFTNTTNLGFTVPDGTGTVNITLPTGTIYFRDNGANLQYSLDGSSYSNVASSPFDVTIGRLEYRFTVTIGGTGTDSSIDSVKIKNVGANNPALLLLEEKTKDNKEDAIIIEITDNTGASTPRLELNNILFTHDSTDKQTSTSVGGTSGLDHHVTKWGTKVVSDKSGSAAGTATITYPDSQVYHLVAVGENPSWITAATEAGTYKTYAPLSLPVAKLASEVTPADKANAHIVLVGGPCANSLVQALVDAGKLDASMTCAGGTPGPAWTPGVAYVKVVEDAFATGRVALVVAGTNAADTRLATSLLSQGRLADRTEDGVRVSGTVTAPVVTPM
jgi:hypothetical protein